MSIATVVVPRVTPYDALLTRLAASSTVADVGSAFLEGAQQVLAADAVGFYRLGQCPTDRPLEVSANLDGTFLEDYEEDGRPDDPVLRYVVQHRVPVDSRRLSPREWRGSGAMRVLSKSGLSHSLQAPVVHLGEVVGTINFAREEPGRPFRDHDLSTAFALSQHLAVALERSRRFHVADARASVLQAAFEQSGRATLICGLDGSIQFISRRGQEIMDAPGMAARVLRAILAVSGDEALTHTAQIDDPAARRKVIAKVHRLRRDDAIACFLYAEETDGEVLPTADMLSPREQHIARMVSRGLSTREMAAEAFISENTVKQHIKRIFAKLNVTSRAELVQHVWALHDANEHTR